MSRTAVIILNWNGSELLRHYLPKVVETTATCPNAEVIVADNASTDNSRDVLKTEFANVKTILLDKNYGFAGGYNRAIANVDHDYVVLLNSDVETTDGWLQPLVSLMDEHNDVAACAPKIRDDKQHSMFEYAGAAGGYLDALGYPFCRGRIMDTLEADNGQYDTDANALWVSGAAIMVRRKVYEELGGLDEDFFAHMEEIDLCWRMCSRGHRVIACGKSHIFHLGGATLNSENPRKTYLNFRNNLSMIIKNYPLRSWWIVLIVRMLLDGVAALRFLMQGKVPFFGAIVKAHLSMYASLGTLLSKRKELKTGRLRKLPSGISKKSIIWHYYVLGQKTFGDIAPFA